MYAICKGEVVMDSVVVAMTIAKTEGLFFSSGELLRRLLWIIGSRIDPLVGFEMFRIGTVIVEPEFLGEPVGP